MSCKICGSGSCCESFHSFEEQELFEKRQEYKERGECYDCEQAEQEVEELNDKYEELSAERDELRAQLAKAIYIDALNTEVLRCAAAVFSADIDCYEAQAQAHNGLINAVRAAKEARE